MMKLETIVVSVDMLTANDWNPNELSEAEFAELVAELEHLGRLPKPLVVRPNGQGYLIVDGEHGWRAAREVGFAEVPCEVIEADDFEAMRQTYKRNQHGTHHAVKLGQMFQRMLAEQDLSIRALAGEVDVSEGTIRNHILYAKAADMRNGYAFEKLGVRQVREYLSLPQVIGDAWLDAGADLKQLFEALRNVKVRSHLRSQIEVDVVWGQEGEGDFGEGFAFAEALVERGFFTSELVKYHRFVRACHIAVQLLVTCADYAHTFPKADEYLRTFAELGARFPVSSLLRLFQELPCTTDEDGTPTPCLTVDEWRDLLSDCTGRTKTVGEFESMTNAAIELALRRKGLGGRENPDITNPHVALMMEGLKDAPRFIRESNLSLRNQVRIHEVNIGSVDPDRVQGWKRRAIEQVEARQRAIDSCWDHDPNQPFDPSRLMAAVSTGSGDVVAVFQAISEAECREDFISARDKLFDDREGLTEALLERANKLYVIREQTIEGELAQAVLVDRLEGLAWPELRLLAAAVLTDFTEGMDPFSVWYSAMCEEAKQ